MKLFKRKISPKIQAWHWDGSQIEMNEACPREIHRFISSTFGDFGYQVTTSGPVEAKLELNIPIWLVLEQDGRGAYPMSEDYMKKNFEESPE